MQGGEIEQSGTPQELYQKPRTRFVASFLGEMNWVGGVGVRPECMRLSRDCTAERRGVIEHATFLGSYRHLTIRLESGEVLTAQTAASVAFSAGETVHVSWDPSDELRFPI